MVAGLLSRNSCGLESYFRWLIPTGFGRKRRERKCSREDKIWSIKERWIISKVWIMIKSKCIVGEKVVCFTNK